MFDRGSNNGEARESNFAEGEVEAAKQTERPPGSRVGHSEPRRRMAVEAVVVAAGYKYIFLFSLLLLYLPILSANETITLTANQTDYYFPIGAEASFMIHVTNPYDKDLSATLAYTVDMRQQSGTMISSNSQSRTESILIQKQATPFEFRLGSQNAPGTHTLTGTTLEYTDPDEVAQVVTLPDIRIHIVEEQQQQEQNQQAQSSSQTKEEQQQAQKEAQEAAEQQRQEEMQRQMREEQEANQFQNRMQNNQLNQNTDALKQQMQEEMQQQQQQQQQMEEALRNSQEFQQALQQMIDEGYNLTGGDMTPTGNESGDFDFQFEDQDGNKAEIEGDIQKNEVTDMKVTKERSLDALMDEIRADQRFQTLSSDLLHQGFEEQSPMMQKLDKNETIVEIPYQDANNETQTIEAKIEDNVITEIELKSDHNLWWILPILALIFAVLLFTLKKKKTEPVPNKPSKPIDYHAEALKMLETAKNLYKDNKRKEAYAKAAETIRYFLSQKHNLKEITNNKLITYLKKNMKDPRDVQSCLSLCGLVEFAKYKPNDEDWSEIVKGAKRIIKA